MTEEQIKEHRSIHPLPFEQITMYSSFTQLVGHVPTDYTPAERYERWTKNMNLLKEAGKMDSYNLWATKAGSDETCMGCIHRDEGKNWCKWSELPCNYNPALKDIGMACMGLAYDTQTQMNV
jgi:hypothetical protein